MKSLFVLFAMFLIGIGALFISYELLVNFYVEGGRGVLLIVVLCLGVSFVFGMMLVYVGRYLRDSNNEGLSSLQMQQIPGARRFAPAEANPMEDLLPPVVELQGRQRQTSRSDLSESSPADRPGNAAQSNRGGSTRPSAGDQARVDPVARRQELDSSRGARDPFLTPDSGPRAGTRSHWTGTKRAGVPSAKADDVEPIVLAEITPENARNLLREQKVEVGNLIEYCVRQLGEVDTRMMKHLTRNTAGSIEGVLNLRRIITSLQKRGQHIETLLAEPGKIDYGQARALYNSDLVVEGDNLNSLIDSKPMQPISPEKWRATINDLFFRISRRKTIFKGMKLGLPPKHPS